MSGWQEFRYWSPVTDTEMCRISMFTTDGQEYWYEIPAGLGKAYIKRRGEIVDAIADAMARGADPGHIEV